MSGFFLPSLLFETLLKGHLFSPLINLVLVLLISIPFKKKNLLKNSVCVSCVEVRGEPEGVASLLLPYGLGTELRLSGVVAGAVLP